MPKSGGQTLIGLLSGVTYPDLEEVGFKMPTVSRKAKNLSFSFLNHQRVSCPLCTTTLGRSAVQSRLSGAFPLAKSVVRTSFLSILLPRKRLWVCWEGIICFCGACGQRGKGMWDEEAAGRMIMRGYCRSLLYPFKSLLLGPFLQHSALQSLCFGMV